MNIIMLCLACVSLTVCKDLHQEPSPTMHYKTINGEVFMMPCKKWTRIEQEMSAVTENSFAQFKAEVAHSGNYTCLTRKHHSTLTLCTLRSTESGGWQVLHLQVVDNTLGCWSAEKSRVTLYIGIRGQIICPGHSCGNSTSTVWYKGNRTVSKSKRKISCPTGHHCLHTVQKHHNGVFFCDRDLRERGVNWTIRSSITVKALHRGIYPPRILRPENNSVQEAELGLNYTLRCVVDFPEADPPGAIQWFLKNNGYLKNMTMEEIENEEVSDSERVKVELRVIGKAVIEQVTSQDINRTYICIAQNTSGNDSATIYLKKNNKKWSSLIEYTLGPILFVSGLGIVVRVKWLEIQLILKSRWTFDKADVGHKDFDVFLSNVWSTTSMEMVSSPLRHNHDDLFPFCLDPLQVEVPSERLELLLPHVLEDQWGYRLCLLDRDFLPGGAYTKDVMNAIQKSQMLICLLSAEYFSDNNAVFVLESGVQALLQNSGFKLQLIWTKKAPVSLPQLDPPLPVVIQKALKVLPALKFTSAKNTDFWRCLRKAMPRQRLSSLQK
ncbi:interleukin-18 receptor accessory protein-like isoform X2 [Boleophthalmus pectinirostris]|uniref:interleukin-18 receptor accessory protein-like isoform X2 n=1 Tax=Boleophthalmus pectinirostris TaxID=150288 RepID=UPI00242DB1FB|nr:interleukin-18 receptor accessory protein-like isoform X2 [Boleophthalmus pectinirostris]